MFCSRSVGVHLLRGIAAFSLIVLTFYFGASQPLLAIPLLLGAFFLLRGCPMCWMVGLFETIRNQRQAKHKKQEAAQTGA